jgi:hypothetical protein
MLLFEVASLRSTKATAGTRVSQLHLTGFKGHLYGFVPVSLERRHTLCHTHYEKRNQDKTMKKVLALVVILLISSNAGAQLFGDKKTPAEERDAIIKQVANDKPEIKKKIKEAP